MLAKSGNGIMEKEIKIEVIFPAYLENKIMAAMKAAHPYEEVAYDVIALSNPYHGDRFGCNWRVG